MAGDSVVHPMSYRTGLCRFGALRVATAALCARMRHRESKSRLRTSTGYLFPVAADDREVAFTRWLTSLQELTSSPDEARRWRERRYSFAYRLGQMLVAESETRGAGAGPIIYGVWLSWGLLYVGQTTKASRRLRDLPVGESHHLANTFPPEI